MSLYADHLEVNSRTRVAWAVGESPTWCVSLTFARAVSEADAEAMLMRWLIDLKATLTRPKSLRYFFAFHHPNPHQPHQVQLDGLVTLDEAPPPSRAADLWPWFARVEWPRDDEAAIRYVADKLDSTDHASRPDRNRGRFGELGCGEVWGGWRSLNSRAVLSVLSADTPMTVGEIRAALVAQDIELPTSGIAKTLRRRINGRARCVIEVEPGFHRLASYDDKVAPIAPRSARTAPRVPAHVDVPATTPGRKRAAAWAALSGLLRELRPSDEPQTTSQFYERLCRRGYPMSRSTLLRQLADLEHGALVKRGSRRIAVGFHSYTWAAVEPVGFDDQQPEPANRDLADVARIIS